MLALMIFHIDLNVISIIGIILLIGIVKKNAIMMIDFALAAERLEGKSTSDAIFEACLLRFRPILMTTMAAIWCASAGIRYWYGVGAAAAAGHNHRWRLIVSQLLTLYTTPVVYLMLDKLRLRMSGKTHDTFRPDLGPDIHPGTGQLT